MGFILLIAAAILYFAGPWFSGQEAVAIVLAVAGVIAVVIQAFFFFKGLKFYNDTKKEINSHYRSGSWSRW